ncbi:MAG: cyclic beta 1-2 glucan synthetase, partial [Methanoregulaceae archaeon]|nr:cyclic beta 1-2 glucan synthetase [Methanoregulaceae archaeon]
LPSYPVLSKGFAGGLSDTLSLLSDAIDSSTKEKKGVVPAAVRSKIADLKDGAARLQGPTCETSKQLSSLDRIASAVLADLSNHPDEEVRWWATATKRQIEMHAQDFKTFTAWESTGNPPDSIRDEVPQDLVPFLSLFFTKFESLNNQVPSLEDVAGIRHDLNTRLGPLLEWLDSPGDTNSISGPGHLWLIRTLAGMRNSGERAEALISSLSLLADQCSAYTEIEYEFLYDRTSNLLAIGYNATDLRRDTSFYDLLASEARLTSFIGIALGQLPQEHWFALGRLLTTIGSGKPTLISWSGSMFEYLMPLLVMPTYENSLLDRTYHAVVARQIEYGRIRGVPWGISESGYNSTDATMNYQYRAFGVPGLGFKRGLAEDLVIAPYAAMMGLMVNPALACSNLEKMESLGYAGKYGFYEAVDFTPSRVPPGQNHRMVESFMAHHQGMALLSLAYVLLNRPMQRRFEADPRLSATVMLLQEKMPRNLPFYPHSGEIQGVHKNTAESGSLVRIFKTPHTPRPEVHLLSNGRY